MRLPDVSFERLLGEIELQPAPFELLKLLRIERAVFAERGVGPRLQAVERFVKI